MLLNEMEIFYYIVEQQSFSKAAARLKVSKSFISKRLDKLEQELKVRLLSRNTRKLTLTEAGENFYRYCSSVVREGQKGYSMMSELQGKPSGLLKISIPPALALNLLSPLFSKFLRRYPEVILDVELESRLVDLVKEGYDLALRSAKLESSNLSAQKIFTIKSVICATPNYLRKHGEITTSSDLSKASHNCAAYSESKSVDYLKLTKQHHEELVHVKGNFISNQLDLIKRLVMQDVCVGVLPEFMVINELQNKQLIQCLSHYTLPTSNLYAVYLEREFMLPRLSCFLDMVKSYLGEQ